MIRPFPTWGALLALLALLAPAAPALAEAPADHAAALAAARDSGQPVLLDFFTDW